MVGGIQDQVLAHDGQTDEAEITPMNDARRSTSIFAGRRRASVSISF